MKKKCKVCEYKIELIKDKIYYEKIIDPISKKHIIFKVINCPFCGDKNVIGYFEERVDGISNRNINKN